MCIRDRFASSLFSPKGEEKETPGGPLFSEAFACHGTDVGCAGTSGIPCAGESASTKQNERREVGKVRGARRSMTGGFRGLFLT